jgi:hypothetical protein
VSEHIPALFEKVFAFSSELDSAADAIEETHTEFRLEVADLPRECGLADMDAERGLRNACGLGDADKVAEMPEFHAGTLMPD